MWNGPLPVFRPQLPRSPGGGIVRGGVPPLLVGSNRGLCPSQISGLLRLVDDRKRPWWIVASLPHQKKPRLLVSCVPHFNPLPTIGNSLEKQKTQYKVLTPSIKPPYEFLWALGAHDTYIYIHVYALLVGKGKILSSHLRKISHISTFGATLANDGVCRQDTVVVDCYHTQCF